MTNTSNTDPGARVRAAQKDLLAFNKRYLKGHACDHRGCRGVYIDPDTGEELLFDRAWEQFKQRKLT